MPLLSYIWYIQFFFWYGSWRKLMGISLSVEIDELFIFYMTKYASIWIIDVANEYRWFSGVVIGTKLLRWSRNIETIDEVGKPI